MIPLWTQLAQEAGLTLSPEQAATLDRYLDLLLEVNQRMNLTRITDRAAAEVQHIADALTVLRHLPAGGVSLVDVGTGGGVPGIPLAIARPELQVTLVESTKKKAAFLREAVQTLGLTNVQVLDQRAEDLGRSPLRETFDVAVARAVGEMVWLVEWCLPLVKKRGTLLAMKGPRHAEEMPKALKAIRLLGGGPATIHPVDLPGTSGHVILEITKVGRCHPAYPRSATEAKAPIA